MFQLFVVVVGFRVVVVVVRERKVGGVVGEGVVWGKEINVWVVDVESMGRKGVEEVRVVGE